MGFPNLQFISHRKLRFLSGASAGLRSRKTRFGKSSYPTKHINTYANNVSDVVYWSEARCNEGGRYVICSLKVGDSKPTEWTPENFNARTLVHEYGGGSFLVHKEVVYFSNFNDQRLYRQTSADAQPEPVTPDGKGLRFADGEFSEKVLQIRVLFCGVHCFIFFNSIRRFTLFKRIIASLGRTM